MNTKFKFINKLKVIFVVAASVLLIPQHVISSELKSRCVNPMPTDYNGKTQEWCRAIFVGGE